MRTLQVVSMGAFIATIAVSQGTERRGQKANPSPMWLYTGIAWYFPHPRPITAAPLGMGPRNLYSLKVTLETLICREV